MGEEILSRLQRIEERNSKVELEKAWEVSWTRFWSNAAVTYLTMVLIIWSIGGTKPLLNAIIPTAGYVLSTLSIPLVKKWWIERIGQ